MRALLSLLLVLAASTVAARDLIGEAEIDGKPVLLFDDGFWRYDDAVGEICTPVQRLGSVCALPSEWSRLPDVDESRYGVPEFVQGEFIADFRGLTPIDDRPITVDKVLAFIGNQTFYDGLKGTVIEATSGKIGDLQGGHVVVSAGQKGVYAFTYANQNGRILIAQTREQNTTIYYSGHRKAHESFVAALRPEPFE